MEERCGSRTLLSGILMTALVSGILQCVLFPSSALLGASGIVFMLIMLSSLAGFSPPRRAVHAEQVHGAPAVRPAVCQQHQHGQQKKGKDHRRVILELQFQLDLFRKQSFPSQYYWRYPLVCAQYAPMRPEKFCVCLRVMAEMGLATVDFDGEMLRLRPLPTSGKFCSSS